MRRLLALVALLALAGCGSSNDKKATKTAPSPVALRGCHRAAAPRPRPDGELDRPPLKIDRSARWTATLRTNCGTIRMSLDVREQPKTVASFVFLARRGFFDNLTFHRIAQQPDGSDFVVQGGDPTGTGQGGPGYKTVDKPPKGTKYTLGVVAMAKTGNEKAGTAGSQFFVVTGNDAGLPPDYAVLGKVVSGLDVVKRVGQLGDSSEQPTFTVVIKKATVG